MRGGAQVKEALGFVTLLWNHPVLTGLLLLIFTPPFFPLVVYFSPLLMSTALCVVALVSVGSQMEKIKAEGGPGQQLETHLGRDHGISTWAPSRDRTRNDQGTHLYGESNNRHRNLYANIHVVPAPPSWTRAQENNTTMEEQLLPVENNDPPSPATAESDEDWWDTWVKEYESRPGWGEQEDQEAFRTPAAIPTSITSQAQAPATIPAFTHKEDAPLKPEIRDDNRREAPVAASVPAPVAMAPVSVSVVTNRQEAPSRSAPSPPTTSTSRSLEEVVVSVKVTDFQPHISALAPIRTGRETPRDRQPQADRIAKTPQQILGVPPTKVETVPAAHVSDAQALQSIEKLLHIESRNAAPVANVKNLTTTSSLTKSASGKGIAVDASEKNRNKIAVDISAGETPLLRHLKISRSENHSRNSSTFLPLPQQQRASRGLMSEKVLPPPQFSPRLLQSLQPLPPKGLSPRLLPNLSTVPLGNPVEKIPQWVYDGIPKERAEMQAMKAETAEEKHVREFEQAVKVLSYTRRRTHVRRPSAIQVETANPQAFQSTPTTSTLENPTEKPSRRSRASSPQKPASRASPVVAASESLPTRNSDDSAVRAHAAAGELYGTSERASSFPMPTPRTSAAPSPRLPSSNPNEASVAAAAESPSLVMAATPPRASRASSPRNAPIAASPRRASPPQMPSTAASPRPAAPAPQSATIAASPRPAPSPKKGSVAASPRRASRASSPSIGSSPWPASIAFPSPQKPPASPPRRPSVPSSPSVSHPRRRRQHSSKLAADKSTLLSSIQIELSTYYDTPAVEKEDSATEEDYVPIEEVRVVEDKANEAAAKGDNATPLQWGRSSYSSRRSSNSRRRLEPRRVVTSEDADMFCLNKSLPSRSGQSVKFVDSSSTTDDERESVTPRASRRSMGRTIKPLVWRSRSVQAHEESD